MTALVIHNANTMFNVGLSSRETSRLELAIQRYKVALRRMAGDDPRVLTVHRKMAIAYWTSYTILGYPPDLEGALEHLAIVVASSATSQISHEDHFLYAQALAFNYDLSMNFHDLEEAIRQIRRAMGMLKTHGAGIPAQVTGLLCSLLRSHHSSTGVFESLDESLLSLRALDNSVPGTATTLFSYAESYRCWCEWRNDGVDWDQCVSLYRQSIRALPERHEDRWWYMSHLASTFCTQYFFNSGKTTHHDESVKLLIEALGQWQEVGSNRPEWRFNSQRRAFLAKLDLHLGFSYASEGQKDKYKAWDMPPGTGYGYGRGVGDTKGLRVSWVLSELGQALHVRYLQFRDKRDLDDALKLIQTAVYIRRKEGLGLARMLAYLAAILMTRHEAGLGDETGLYEARVAVLELHDLAREDYGATLLGPSLRGRLAILVASSAAVNDESSKEAMDLHVSALQQCPATYYIRPTLLYTYSLPASQVSTPAPPESPLSLVGKALALTPPNSPLRLQMLIHCTRIHWEHYQETGSRSEFTSAMSKFDEAIHLEGAGPDARLDHAMQWLASISMDKDSSTTNLDEYKRLFEAQRSLLALLPNVASLGRDVQSRLDAAKAFQNLAQTIAIKAPDVPSVVEVLEEGRSVFWGQALRLRLPPEIEKRTDPALKELAKALEGEWDKKVQKEAWELETNWHSRETMREIFDWKPTPIFQEEKALHRREELIRFNELVASARKVPGCERLMMPDSFHELKKAGDHGVIVLLVASDSLCEAIAIGSCSGGEKALRLPLDMSLAALRDLCGSHREAYLTSRSVDRSLREERRPIIKAQDPKVLSKSKFYNVLKVLWLKVVSPVLLALGLKVREIIVTHGFPLTFN
ncbi:hypothetical protein FS749_011633 [Ceratobasidium sp. UAMH 11750]|nr:hypothetical protein FS749_011633 [Ceratobasidium sp. UAMH 11750]